MNNTSADDEREALIEKIKLAGHLSAQVMVFQGDTYPVKTIPYTSFLHILDGFRRSDVPEPSAEPPLRSAWHATPAVTSRGAEPQGEPSDAQVLAALNAYYADYMVGPNRSLDEVRPPRMVQDMRAALRAAGGAR